MAKAQETAGTFDGNGTNWPVFWDWCLSTVGNQPISDEQKIAYFASCMVGPANQLIEAYQLQNPSYSDIVKRVKERFANNEIVMQQLYAQLERMPRIQEGRQVHRWILQDLERKKLENDSWDVTKLRKFLSSVAPTQEAVHRITSEVGGIKISERPPFKESEPSVYGKDASAVSVVPELMASVSNQMATTNKGQATLLMCVLATAADQLRQKCERVLVFIDTGSQRSFTTEGLARKLNLPSLQVHCKRNNAQCSACTSHLLKHHFIEKRASLPMVACDDPDVLIGMDQLSKIMETSPPKAMKSGFSIYDTKLGPIIADRGRVSHSFNRNNSSVDNIFTVESTQEIDPVSLFGKLEAIGIKEASESEDDEMPKWPLKKWLVGNLMIEYASGGRGSPTYIISLYQTIMDCVTVD
uniref:Uncharacterized protein n=1 Tax=Parascaris equorum TaxID=6256 RepID=A0A914S626_PAREQ